MKKLLTIVTILPCLTQAQETINSNNINHSTQSNVITNTHQDVYNNHQQDSSVTTHTSTDNSSGAFRNNPIQSNNQLNSNNQWNYSQQEITNNNMRNVSGTSESYNGTQSGDITNDVSSASGADSNSMASAGSSSVSINQNIPRQAPMAWAPGMAAGFSPFNCENSASIGLSSPFGAIAGGMPITASDCVRHHDVMMFMAWQQYRVACERMIQHEGNAAALRAAGTTCEQMATPVAAVVPVTNYEERHPSADYWRNQERLLNDRLNTMQYVNSIK
jgi:hypothetical protein